MTKQQAEQIEQAMAMIAVVQIELRKEMREHVANDTVSANHMEVAGVISELNKLSTAAGFLRQSLNVRFERP